MNTLNSWKKSKRKDRKLVSSCLLAILFTLPFLASGQKDWGVGIRFGDPSGLSLKKYFQDRALELNIGRTHWSYNDDWYDHRFVKWYDNRRLNFRDLVYLGYQRSVPIGIQLHYLIQKEIGQSKQRTASGLDWYYGVGVQARLQGYRYDYRYRLDGNRNNDWFYETGKQIIDLDLGTDIVAGLEYTFPKTPVSLFLDATLFMEIIDDPFIFWLHAGIGGRFNF